MSTSTAQRIHAQTHPPQSCPWCLAEQGLQQPPTHTATICPRHLAELRRQLEKRHAPRAS